MFLVCSMTGRFGFWLVCGTCVCRAISSSVRFVLCFRLLVGFAFGGCFGLRFGWFGLVVLLGLGGWCLGWVLVCGLAFDNWLIWVFFGGHWFVVGLVWCFILGLLLWAVCFRV